MVPVAGEPFAGRAARQVGGCHVTARPVSARPVFASQAGAHAGARISRNRPSGEPLDGPLHERAVAPPPDEGAVANDERPADER